jgi:hypothetical protein
MSTLVKLQGPQLIYVHVCYLGCDEFSLLCQNADLRKNLVCTVVDRLSMNFDDANQKKNLNANFSKVSS